MLLLLLLMGNAVLLSLVASGAGGDEHLPLTKKLTVQRVWSNLTCVAMGPRTPPETGRELIFHCCSNLQRFVKYRSQNSENSASVFGFCESRPQARIAALIEQWTDSSVASSVKQTEFENHKLRILSLAFALRRRSSTMHRLVGMVHFNF